MRRGTIIEENSPKYFIEKYNQNLLEDIFFKISSNNDDNFIEVKHNGSNKTYETSNSVKSFKKSWNDLSNKFHLSRDRLNANLYKDTLKCKRNTKLLIVQLLIPIIQITFFCLCIGRTPKNLPIGIINFDNESSPDLGQEIIDSMSNEIIIKQNFRNFETGFKELKNGRIFCLIKIDKNFSAGITDSVLTQVLPDSYLSQMHIYMESTKNQISYTIQDQIVESLKNVTLKYLNLFKPYNKTDYPFIFENKNYNEDKSSFTDYMAPGIALSVIFFLSVASTASNYVLERQLGLIERSHLAGVKIIELLFSQLIIYSVLMIAQIFIVLVLLYFLLDIEIKINSIPLMISLIFSQGFCGLCYGLFLASVNNV